MVQYFGDFAEDDTVNIPFNTFDSNDPAASVTITNLADADIMVHKDAGLTQIVTDGASVVINFDGVTGNHMVTIDTSVDAAYSPGSEYAVRIEGTTVDGGTINAWIGAFSIERAGGALALIKAGNLSANVVQISGDGPAADNLELMYDGTGYTDDTAPASRSQVSGIVNTGMAINVLAIASPDGFTLTTGSEVNNEDSTHALDGINHELSDAAGTLDAVYKFDIGGDAAPVGLQITGVFNSANDSWAISANAGTDGTPVWQQVGTVSGTGGTGITVHAFDLFSDQIVSDLAGIVQIRVNGTGLTSSSFDVDQIFVSMSDTSRSVGYANGAVWVDTVGGVSGTESFVNGVADKKVNTFANAITIADAVGLDNFEMNPDAAITLAATINSRTLLGRGWTLALGGQDINDLHVFGAGVTGVSTAATRCGFHDCKFGTASIQRAFVENSTFSGTVTMTLAGDYNFVNDESAVAGAGGPTFSKTAGQTITAAWRRWSGSMNLTGLEVGDTITISGELGTIDLGSPAGAVAIEIRGTYKEITNEGSAVVNLGGAIKGENVASILADTDATIPALIATVQADLNIITGADGAVLLSGTQTSIDAIEEDTNELQSDNVPGLIAALNNISGADVNAEVVDVMDVDTVTLPGQEAPPLAPTRTEMQAWGYKILRNRKTQTATQWSLLADDESTVDAKATISDDNTTAIKQEIVTGP